MKTVIALIGVTLAALVATPVEIAAQDLAIVNGRILDGKGGVIERGTVVVRAGKIVSVGSGAAPSGVQRIDAQGRTVMPGFIDAHRHIAQGDAAEWLAKRAPAQMQEFLDAGFTTVLCAICPDQAIELRERIASGTMRGPRLLVGQIIPVARPAAAGGRGGGGGRGGDPARFDTSRPPLRPTEPAGAIPPADTIKTVESIASRKYDFLKTIMTTTPGGPEVETLKLVVSEGKKRGVATITHAVSVIDTLAAVEARPDVLVHTPHIGQLDEAQAKRIAGAGIPMTSTLQVFVPHFGADNTPLFRDAQPFPWNTLSSAGQGPVNARLLWEAGISYGYGTDTTWPPKQSLADELRALSLVFSPRDVSKIMGQGAARSALRQDIGTLEPGNVADIVLIDGNPLTNLNDLLNVMVTIKEGRIVFDSRPSTALGARRNGRAAR
jgi:imidazolonepropionase-like amidohydrolase